METSQSVLNGKKYLQDRRTIMLGIYSGNPYYYRLDVLERLCDFARNNSDKVLLFIPDKISEHKYRAVGSKNPKKSARTKANRLRNKCNEAIQSSGLCDRAYSFVRWAEEVETCPQYTVAYQYIQELYQENAEFRAKIRKTTGEALSRLQNGRKKDRCCSEKKDVAESMVDLEEGMKYPLKTLAFLTAVSSIYESCTEFVFVYHRFWPVLNKFFDGCYDGVVRPSLGFLVYEQ